jgi:hypothetical protein
VNANVTRDVGVGCAGLTDSPWVAVVVDDLGAEPLDAEAPEVGCVAGEELPPQAASKRTVANAGRAVRLIRG